MNKTESFKCFSHHVYESPKMYLYSVESESFLASSVGTGGNAGGTGSDFPWATNDIMGNTDDNVFEE